MVLLAVKNQVALSDKASDASGSGSDADLAQSSPDAVQTDTDVIPAVRLQTLGLQRGADRLAVFENILDVIKTPFNGLVC